MVVRPVFTHPWEVSPAEAMEIQRQLRRRVIIVPLDCGPGTVAGIDVGVKGKQARAAVVLYSYPGLGPFRRPRQRCRFRFPACRGCWPSVPDEQKGSWVPLVDGDQVIGAVVRTRDGVRPVFVSV